MTVTSWIVSYRRIEGFSMIRVDFVSTTKGIIIAVKSKRTRVHFCHKVDKIEPRFLWTNLKISCLIVR